ncbi:MAG TPA: lysophospholipid acyltransferase family protein [Desulfurivibrionaceae bacterium]|nr:lysophospholipid acyltransferase family protein [Desulfurivibrionaceae bacterium]
MEFPLPVEKNTLNRLPALLVLLIAPFLTLACSLAVLIGRGLLRIPVVKIQAVPRFWGWLITAWSGISVRVEGLERLDRSKPYIFVANHQSQFDIFVLDGFLDIDFRWLAKKELFRLPLFGWAMLLAGSIPVDRSHGRKALKSLDEAAKRIAGGASVVIFPEGTRSPDGQLQSFKSGAMQLAIKSGVELVPMAISGTHEVLPKGKILARPGKVVIRLGTPVDSREFSSKEKQALAELLHDRVALLLRQGV